jgi:parallel beta-helix repeat protein
MANTHANESAVQKLRVLLLAACLIAACLITRHKTFASTRIVNVSTSAQLTSALSNAQPGDDIVLAPGTYSGNFTGAADGTASSPITIESASSSNKAVLDGGSLTSGYTLHITGDYWVVKNVNVTRGQKGIMLDNSNHTLIDSVEVYNIGQEGVHFRDGSSNNTIQNCYVHDTGVDTPDYGEGIYVGSDKSKWGTYNAAADHNIINNNRIGPNVAAEHVDIKEGTTGTVVEYNTLNGTGISGANYADSFIDVKGNNASIHHNTGYRNNNSVIVDAFQVHVQVSGWGQNEDFSNNAVYLDNTTDYVVNVASGGSATASDNTRSPAGNMYNGNVTVTGGGGGGGGGSGGSGGAAALAPTDDSYVRDGSNADKNYGTDTMLYVKTDSSGSERNAYLKFDLSGVGSVTSAKLRVYGYASAATVLTAYQTADGWSEGSITWNNAPAAGSAINSVSMNTTQQYYEIDVTSYVSAQANGDKTASFVLQESAGKYTQINSSENASNPPQLVIN